MNKHIYIIDPAAISDAYNGYVKEKKGGPIPPTNDIYNGFIVGCIVGVIVGIIVGIIIGFIVGVIIGFIVGTVATFATVNNGNIGYNKYINNDNIATTFAAVNTGDIGHNNKELFFLKNEH